jgi:electron transfer flavoprotein beta subunit
MDILVLVKQTPDTETRFKIKDGEIDTSSIKWVMSPYDEFAVEEALQLKSKIPEAKVTILSLGPKRAIETIRTGLAMGADEGLLVETEKTPDPQSTAKALAKVIEKEFQPKMIFGGWKAIDDDAAQVTQALAERLQLPHAFMVNKFEYKEDKIQVQRELEGGKIEVLEAPVPCVVACQKGLNKPRYAALPNIMKAKKKPVKEIPYDELGIDESNVVEVVSTELPPEKGPGKILKPSGPEEYEEKVNELVKLLKEDAKVL